MVQIVFPFERFPWFNSERRPVHISGQAVCRLTKITESATQGDPCRVNWVIDKVECDIGQGKKKLVNFNKDRKDNEDFARWLNGRHGIVIANLLRDAHGREASTTENA